MLISSSSISTHRWDFLKTIFLLFYSTFQSSEHVFFYYVKLSSPINFNKTFEKFFLFNLDQHAIISLFILCHLVVLLILRLCFRHPKQPQMQTVGMHNRDPSRTWIGTRPSEDEEYARKLTDLPSTPKFQRSRRPRKRRSPKLQCHPSVLQPSDHFARPCSTRLQRVLK